MTDGMATIYLKYEHEKKQPLLEIQRDHMPRLYA